MGGIMVVFEFIFLFLFSAVRWTVFANPELMRKLDAEPGVLVNLTDANWLGELRGAQAVVETAPDAPEREHTIQVPPAR